MTRVVQHIFLLGMTGSGKSSVGRALAQALSLPFYDIDALIEARAGMSITQIFNTRGEAAFRDLESQCLQSLAAEPAGVVATGGGIVEREENCRYLKTHGFPIVLDTSLSTLEERLQCEVAHRPLLARENWQVQLAELARQRAPIYGKFSRHIAVDHCSIEKIVANIEKLVQQR